MNILKKFLTIAICVVLAFGAVSTYAFGEGDNPDITGTSAIIFSGDTDEVIWEKNADAKMDPASMTKLLTCLLAAENMDLDTVVEITAEAAAQVETNIDLVEGEKITVRDLLYAALLVSGNDAAVALGVATAGSVEAFAAMMNERAAEIGCKGTHFINPSGLDDPEHYSTARDMALIAREALSNKTLRQIAGTTEYKIAATNMSSERELKTSNYFLTGVDEEKYGVKLKVDKYEGVFGGKTGRVADNKCTMVTGIDCDGLEVYCVVMGSTLQGRYSDLKVLMDYAKANVTKYTAFKKGKNFGDVKLLGGATNKVGAVADDNGFINLPEGASASLVTTECVYTNSLTAPVAKGQKIGVVNIYIAGDLKRTVDLVAAENVEKGWFLSGIGITNLQTIIIGAVLAFLLLAVIVIMIMRISNKRKAARIRRAKIAEAARRQLEREKDLKDRNWPY